MNSTAHRRLWQLFRVVLLIYLFAAIPWRSYGVPISLHSTDLRRALLLIGAAWCLHYKRTGGDLWHHPFLTNPRLPWLILGCYYVAALVSIFAQIYAYRIPMYDTGIFHQAIWSAAKGHGFFTSISGSGDHMQDHFSWSFTMLVPLMIATHGGPWTLPVTQVTMVFSGFAAWVWFAQQDGTSNDLGRYQNRLLPLGIALFACFFDSAWQNIWWGFHETTFCFVAWSWFLALQWHPNNRTGGQILLFILLAVGAFSKETALVEAAGLAFVSAFFCLKRRESRARIGLWVLIAFVLIAVLYWFEIQPKPADKNYFDRYYSYLGHNIRDVIFTLCADPLRPIRVLGSHAFLKFMFDFIWPWLGLPLFWIANRKDFKDFHWLWFIGFLPGIGLLMLSTFEPLRDPAFHYAMSVWPVLAIMSIAALRRLKTPIFLCALVLIAGWTQSKDAIENTHISLKDIATYEYAPLPIEDIPANAKVSASERAGAWLSKFRMVTRWPELTFFGDQCPDYILIHQEYKDALPGQSKCFSATASVSTEVSGPWTRYKISTNPAEHR